MIVTSTILPLDRLLERLITVEDMRAVGELARLQIVQRTKSGTPPEGVRWAPYTPEYLLRKEHGIGDARGAVIGHSGYGNVNLTASGEMLDNLKVIEASRRHVTLGWLR